MIPYDMLLPVPRLPFLLDIYDRMHLDRQRRARALHRQHLSLQNGFFSTSRLDRKRPSTSKSKSLSNPAFAQYHREMKPLDVPGHYQRRSLRLIPVLLAVFLLLDAPSSINAFVVRGLQQQRPQLQRPVSSHARLPSTFKPAITQATTSTAADSITTSTTIAPDETLGKILAEAGAGCGKLDLKNVFQALLTAPNSPFLDKYWQREPCYTATSIPCLAQAWTMADMEDAIAREFLLAGRGFFEEEGSKMSGGWKMATVGEARGSSFEDAKLRPEDVRAALAKRSGTVVFNSVGGSVAALAGVCLDAVETFLLPVALNLYLTAPGQATSAPPHTDKQDVFVLQTQGRKRWRVYSPPAPGKKAHVDPFARGKDADNLSLSELGTPLVDMVLGPGQMLYMPAGFPHTTDTVVGMTGEKDSSVHLTLGVDTHIWGLTHATLRDYFLYRLSYNGGSSSGSDMIPPPPPSTLADASAFIQYHSQLPIGAREARAVPGGEGGAERIAPKRWSELKKVLGDAVIEEFKQVICAVDDQDVLASLKEKGGKEEEVLRQVVAKVIDHHRSLTAVFRSMYVDVKFGLTEVPRDLSCLRSQAYYQNIENTMQALVEWAAPPSLPPSPAAAAAGAAGGGGGAGGSKGGFGGGGGKKPAGGKGGGKKKK